MMSLEAFSNWAFRSAMAARLGSGQDFVITRPPMSVNESSAVFVSASEVWQFSHSWLAWLAIDRGGENHELFRHGRDRLRRPVPGQQTAQAQRHDPRAGAQGFGEEARRDCREDGLGSQPHRRGHW